MKNLVSSNHLLSLPFSFPLSTLPSPSPDHPFPLPFTQLPPPPLPPSCSFLTHLSNLISASFIPHEEQDVSGTPLSTTLTPHTITKGNLLFVGVVRSRSCIYKNSCFILASFPGHSQILSVEKIWLIFFTAIYKLKSGPIFLHSCKLKSGSSLGTRLVYSLSETAQQHS